MVNFDSKNKYGIRRIKLSNNINAPKRRNQFKIKNYQISSIEEGKVDQFHEMQNGQQMQTKSKSRLPMSSNNIYSNQEQVILRSYIGSHNLSIIG